MELVVIAVVETAFAADAMDVKSSPALLAMAQAIVGSVMEIFGVRLAMAVAGPNHSDNNSPVVRYRGAILIKMSLFNNWKGEYIYEKIFYCRKKAGLSQEALAEELGVSRQAVSKWETGDAVPEIGKLVSLAKTFDVTTDWLLSEEEPEEEQPQLSNQELFTQENFFDFDALLEDNSVPTENPKNKE